jgi:hypothetical protein
VVLASQIGSLGESSQSAWEFAQPPHAPDGVHTRSPGQLSGVVLHGSHLPALLQMGVSPLQPLLLAGLHSTQVPLRQ